MSARPASSRARRWVAAASVAAALLAALFVWWAWPRARWQVSVAADTDDVSPWAQVALDATITPASVDDPSFRFRWTSDGAPIEPTGRRIAWHSGVEGSHLLEVTAVGPGGVVHRARVAVAVRARDYVGVTGARMAAPPPLPPSSLPFGVADVRVEKSDVCQGESTRIQVQPFDTRGEDKWLRPDVDGQQSWEITYTPTMVPPGLHRIGVAVTDEQGDTVETAAYVNVKDCVAPYPMLVRHESVPPDPDYVAFTALVFKGPEWQTWSRDPAAHRGPLPRATPAAFVWDFGDGNKATSTDPFVRHRYPAEAMRPVERITSYPVHVDAVDADGRTMATAYTTVGLFNAIHALAREQRTLQLVSDVPPGPATTLPDGARTVAVTLRNIHPTETAQITSLVEKLVPCSGRDPTVRRVEASAVLSADTVAPSSSIDGTLTVPASELDSICTVAVEVEGASRPGGLRVTGVFALQTGNTPGQALTPGQAAVLAMAREHLGGASVISVADIQRLEDQGVIQRGVLTPAARVQ